MRARLEGACRNWLCLHGLMVCMFLLLVALPGPPLLHAADDSLTANTGTAVTVPAADAQAEGADEYGDVTEEETGSDPTAGSSPSDEYGNVPEEADSAEGAHIADPIEPWNRAMYHVNDKLYFWLLKPVARGYRYIVPEYVRGMFSNFYQNIKAPIRIVNNLLQGKPKYAALELSRFVINSTIGVAGFWERATKNFCINGREADFGQTLGKYGVGFGFYIVWPILGPSSPRDTLGWAGDRALAPTSYVSSATISPESVGLFAHEKTNYTSFHIGDYEAIKGAAIDPYIAMRDAYVQYRKKVVEE
jgi:phospholipid-binding lipoprotein MlaA